MGSFTICAVEMLLDNKYEEVEKGETCDTRERERQDMHTEFW
jgi:5-methylcytosine-specific restriction endonuclease McrBC regulatory subunit McrC